MPTLAEITSLLDSWYPPHYADDWDAVGLVVGDPTAQVRRILVAVDPVEAVANEARVSGADLIICHHPLFLKGVNSVAATSAKGKLAHGLISEGIALFTAHTNADSPTGGVSEAIAEALGLGNIRPLDADEDADLDKIVVFVPASAAESVRVALADAGAGAIGDYDSCSFQTQGTGRFRPLQGANPTVGSVGSVETVDEVRIEAVLPRVRRGAVVSAMKQAHPYEEPAFDVIELAPMPAPNRGSGRIGELPAPESLRAFAERVARTVPVTAHGVRVAGEAEQQVSRVALCGGSGDFLLGKARASGADVYLTSDLRHHPASEFREEGAMALVDIAHYAAESMWLPVLRQRLASALGDKVEVIASEVNTDPWTFRL